MTQKHAQQAHNFPVLLVLPACEQPEEIKRLRSPIDEIVMVSIGSLFLWLRYDKARTIAKLPN